MLAAMHALRHPAAPLAAVHLLLAALAAACSPSGTPLPPGSVLFQDDFSRLSSGWLSQHTADAILEYRDGQYAVLVLAPDASIWSTPGLDLGSVRLEVDAQQIGGPEDNLYGLICRYQDDANFVFLVVSSDGFAGIGEVRDGERRILSGGAMLPSDAIAPRGYANHLTAECLEETLRLSVNGSLAAEAAAHAPSLGDVGVIVGSYAKAGVEIVFDSFSARVPETSP
jgi:hypothetical protein